MKSDFFRGNLQNLLIIILFPKFFLVLTATFSAFDKGHSQGVKLLFTLLISAVLFTVLSFYCLTM